MEGKYLPESHALSGRFRWQVGRLSRPCGRELPAVEQDQSHRLQLASSARERVRENDTLLAGNTHTYTHSVKCTGSGQVTENRELWV